MKLLLFTILFLSIKAYPQDRVYELNYVTDEPELGYLVGYDSSFNHWYVQRIYKVETWQNKEIPCSTVYHWRGDKDSMGAYVYNSFDTTSICGGGFGMAFFSEYVGDSVISYSCKQWEYSLYKVDYYMPAKSKKWKVGEKYELKKNEHYADYKLWYPPPLIIICG